MGVRGFLLFFFSYMMFKHSVKFIQRRQGRIFCFTVREESESSAWDSGTETRSGHLLGAISLSVGS